MGTPATRSPVHKNKHQKMPVLLQEKRPNKAADSGERSQTRRMSQVTTHSAMQIRGLGAFGKDVDESLCASLCDESLSIYEDFF